MRAMRIRTIAIVLAALAAMAATCASAGIFRCKDARGGVTYQEIPCVSADERPTDIPTAFPEVNYAERDRLLRREAELDARLLRRAEIDAQVQIAREDRLAREREAELMRQAAAETYGFAGGWLIPMRGFGFVNHPRPKPGQRAQPRWP